MYKHTSIIVMALILVSSFTLAAQPLEEVQTTSPIVVTEQSPVVGGLLYMYEEEKFARDVYLALYDTWGLRTFSNIAQAEQRHMDMVGVLIEARNLENPIASTAAGEFKNTDLATLYNSLLNQGMQSITDAYLVGAVIENRDIADLNEYLKQTTDETEQWVYTNLLRSSKNHLRAFSRQPKRFGLSPIRKGTEQLPRPLAGD